MIILGLGTNFGDREDSLRRAAALLRTLFSDVHFSAVYESRALLPADAPAEWNKPFLNMAARCETTLEPHQLLALLQASERRLGRVTRGHWGPREIDIDILAYDDYEMADETLVIPHREVLVRDFALIPLAEIAPNWLHPGANGRTARELAAQMASTLKKTDIIIA